MAIIIKQQVLSREEKDKKKQEWKEKWQEQWSEKCFDQAYKWGEPRERSSK